ncbi:MAG: LamG domain-containing protein [Planctomycetes bacterium]|nr:LamG domain-containing protein [Planctomycetota bacterium]
MRYGMLTSVLMVVAGFLASGVCAAQEGLLGHWKFDEGQGDVAVDSSGNENDGDIWGAEWVRGEFGTALRFDGNGAHVAIPEVPGLDGSRELTVEAWVSWEGSGNYPNIMTGGTWSPGGFLLFVANDQCSFRMGRPGFSASGEREQWREISSPLLAKFEQNRWYHIAATFQRPTITTYVDGQPVGSATWDHDVGYANDLIIGKWAGPVSHTGLIDEVRLFNRAVAPESIKASYEAGSRGRAGLPRPKAPYEKIPRSSQLASAAAVLENECAKLAISSQGRCICLIDRGTGEDHILRTAPMVSIKVGDEYHRRAACSQEGDTLRFRFEKAKTTVVLRAVTKRRHFVFQLESVDGPEPSEIEFVHLDVTPRQHVDAMSGLAATDDFGVCLRTLNLPTHVHVGGNPPVLSAKAARKGELVGSGAVLVACPMPQMRPALADALRDEGVLHSKLGGPFALDAEENRGSYVFAVVSEKDVDQWIDLARRAGIGTIHLIGWEKSLGHYEPRQDLFPNGLDGLKSAVEKMHAAGLRAGIHTLTGCIDPNDPWVRPVPDPRLATDGTYTLASDINDADSDVPTAEPPGKHPTIWAYSSDGNCIRIDDELILYSAISHDGKTGFFKCQRGAFGTKAAAHAKGAPVHHMFVRYGCFVPDEESTLVDEVADAIAKLYNRCGLDQIYMDGAEAMRGWYGIARMRQAIFARLTRPALVEASCWDHHSWPFHSRIGAWDHPVWGLKRFADDHLRAVQQYRRGSLLEAQLGWWVILGPSRDGPMETPDEIEYLSVKAIGHDVPLSFQNVTATGQPPNARQNEYLTTIGNCERLRLANYFSDEVREKLRAERQEFRLAHTEQGQWQFLPTDYLAHKVTSLTDGSSEWVIENRHAAQPLKLRIHALYSALPYDDPQSLTLADFSSPTDFAAGPSAPKVRGAVASDGQPRVAGEGCGRLSATNDGDSPVGAWTSASRQFEPNVDLTPYDAIGVWVHGDGKGELLNLQLTNLPEYFHTLDDHYVKIDFQGWRYCELLLRERDAAAYHDYQWPYGAHCVLHRSPLVRHAVNKLTLYLNNLPPGDAVSVQLSPLKALRTRKVVLRDPAVELGGKRLVFPVDLESGMTIEFESMDDCRVYDERGALVRWLRPNGEVPALLPGGNSVDFSCQGPEGLNSRAEVTVITAGRPLQGRRPDREIAWPLLAREYEPPRTIMALDGHQNQWHVASRAPAGQADLELALSVEKTCDEMAAYESSTSITLESFEAEPSRPGTSPPQAGFTYDTQFRATGCNPGVTQELVRSSEFVKHGDSGARYSAVSTRDDNGGWSYTSKPLAEPLDLSRFAAIGFWLHGDGQNEAFKFQLSDAEGGWQDMVTVVDFTGWRYCQFPLGGPSLKDPRRIRAINIYYNGIPAGKRVTCHVDEIRAVCAAEPLRDPEFLIAGQRLRFPVALDAGDTLTFQGMDRCTLRRASGAVEPVKPIGANATLRTGPNSITFSLPNGPASDFRVVVSTTTIYP